MISGSDLLPLAVAGPSITAGYWVRAGVDHVLESLLSRLLQGNRQGAEVSAISLTRRFSEGTGSHCSGGGTVEVREGRIIGVCT